MTNNVPADSLGPPGRISLSPDGRIRGCDRVAATLLGRDHSALPGMVLGQFVARPYTAVFEGLLASVVASRRPGEAAIGLRAAEGTMVLVRVRALPSAAGPCIDVTLTPLGAREGADPGGLAISVPFRTVADALPAMIAYWTRGLRCGFANKAYIDWFGRAPEQVIGLDLRQLLGDELFVLNEPYIRGALEGRPQGFERTLTKASGELGYTWAQYIPDVLDGVVQGFFVLVSDITELKRAQQAARENEARFHAVIDASPVAHALVDASGGIGYVNPAFRDDFGYTLEDIPTLERWWTAAVADPSERAAAVATWRTRLAEAEASGRPFEPLELRIRCKDGGQRTILARAAPLGATDGGSLLVLRDVTDERRLEREVLDTAAREQHRFGVELHENLAQHLAAASMTLDVLCARGAPATTAELAELATRLRACVGTMRGMAYALSPVDLGFGGLSGALARLAASTRARRHVEVTLTLTGLDEAALEALVTEHVYRIAQEALTQAVQHRRGTEFGIEATVADDRLLLVVRDNGLGVAGADAGPGVSIMRYRARALGAELTVDAAPGSGTTVRLVCPLRRSGSVLRARDVVIQPDDDVTWH